MWNIRIFTFGIFRRNNGKPPSFFTQNKTVFERILYSSSVRFTNSDSVKSSLSNNRLIPDITRLKMPGSSFLVCPEVFCLAFPSRL